MYAHVHLHVHPHVYGIQVSRVEYTFGYKRSDDDGKPRIFLHHSSVPYKA